MDVSTIINYGLGKIESHIDENLEKNHITLTDSLEFLIIKTILDNYTKNADSFDSLDLIDKVTDYCMRLSNPIN